MGSIVQCATGYQSALRSLVQFSVSMFKQKTFLHIISLYTGALMVPVNHLVWGRGCWLACGWLAFHSGGKQEDSKLFSLCYTETIVIHQV